ncbi:MAG: PIN domain-containing protein [Burkholderiales bacterium]|nr:MAG: PIN domain-containing protein [Burkholderiales bacterium]TAG80935.1 MAG: PIN domain-containing protein [Betaproteobacteria bacterium]
MIAVDTNILVYAHREELAFHELAFATLQRVANSNAPWGIPWPCVHEFVATVTNPRAFNPPSTLTQVKRQLDEWFACPSLQMLTTTNDHWHTLHEVLTRSGAVGGAVHDARIAAICIENGVKELWTADRDFAKFKGLKSSNPLVS